jgi:Bacteriophage HK97-gp10, putative tail-component
MRISVEVDAEALRLAMESLKGAITTGVAIGLDRAGQRIENTLKRAAPVKSGRLRGSLGYRVNHGTELEVGSLTGDTALIYARQVEFGGTIVGKPWLAIPLSSMKTKAGVGGIRARDVRASPSQFGYSGTFVAKGVVFGKLPGKTKKGGKNIVPLFALKKSVDQKGRPYLIPTVERDLPMVADEIKEAFDAAAGGGK